MFFLQILGWFVFSCILMSFVEHQVHARLMHRRSVERFKKTFEAHAILHHKIHYPDIFCDEPVPPGEDKEIRLTVRKAPIKALPVAAIIALVSWQGALILMAVVTMHHWIWNQIHLEMHKPVGRGFSNWPIYKFLARYHWMHHKYPYKNFNVVFPLADYVLGTHVRASEAELQEMYQLGFGPAPAPARVATAATEKTLVSSAKDDRR